MIRRGDVETELCRLFVRLFKEATGRGPIETKAYLTEDLLIVRCSGVLAAHEKLLLASPKEQTQQLVKQLRREAITLYRSSIEQTIINLTGTPIRTIHHDICTQTDELIVVITLLKRLYFEE